MTKRGGILGALLLVLAPGARRAYVALSVPGRRDFQWLAGGALVPPHAASNPSTTMPTRPRTHSPIDGRKSVTDARSTASPVPSTRIAAT